MPEVRNMKAVYLVSCVSEKRASELPAEHLYCSDWFQKARTYVLRHMKPGDEWHILSAKYGLLHPSTNVRPYNETLSDLRKSERMDWAQRVIKQLRTALYAGDTVVFLAGQKYREFLEPAVLTFGCQVSVPMRGMRIGEQLSWLGNAGRL
jgi:hypothetical protein